MRRVHRFTCMAVCAAVLGLLLGGVGQARAATLTHIYELNGSYADTLGGPTLVDAGGTLNPTNYSFGPNQGLSLSDALEDPADYSIEILFNFSVLSGFRKILDFKDFFTDRGLYTVDTKLVFFSSANGPSGAFSPNVDALVVVTRDGSSGDFVGYVDGVQQFFFNDGGNLAIFSAADNIIQFFQDDNISGQSEASAGVVDRIRIYDGALTPAEVAGIPEPSTGLLFASGLAVLAMGRRRSG